MTTHPKEKKDYSRCYDPLFEEICDRAEELAKAEGEDREGVLSVIRYPICAGRPMAPFDQYWEWAKAMRQKASALLAAEREQEKSEQESEEEEKREKEGKEGKEEKGNEREKREKAQTPRFPLTSANPNRPAMQCGCDPPRTVCRKTPYGSASP